MTTLVQGMRGATLLIEMNADRLVFALAVGAALAVASIVGAELLHPVVPVEPFLP